MIHKKSIFLKSKKNVKKFIPVVLAPLLSFEKFCSFGGLKKSFTVIQEIRIINLEGNGSQTTNRLKGAFIDCKFKERAILAAE